MQHIKVRDASVLTEILYNGHIIGSHKDGSYSVDEQGQYKTVDDAIDYIHAVGAKQYSFTEDTENPHAGDRGFEGPYADED